jgi:hypothetical protein
VPLQSGQKNDGGPVVGDGVPDVGGTVGPFVGRGVDAGAVGAFVNVGKVAPGPVVGAFVGPPVGDAVGPEVGVFVGATVGPAVGAFVKVGKVAPGTVVGAFVGPAVGDVGVTVGMLVDEQMP